MREILKLVFFFLAVYGTVKMWTQIIKDMRGNK